jgi:hypothetical protein
MVSLSDAAKNGDINAIINLINHGHNINQRDRLGQTPILLAAAFGRKEIFEFLANNGADVNKVDDFGRTPVLWAAANGHKEIVEFLAGRGADVNKVDDFGETPILLAAVRGHKETVAQLMVCGASLASPDNINTEVIAGTIQEAFSYLVEHEKNIPLLIEIIAKIKNQDNLPCTLFDSCKGALFKDANIWGDYIANIQFCNMTSKAEDKKKSSWSNVPEEVKRKIFSFRYGNSEQLLLSKEITAKYQQTIEKAIEAKREGGEEAFNRLEWSPRTKRKVS